MATKAAVTPPATPHHQETVATPPVMTLPAEVMGVAVSAADMEVLAAGMEAHQGMTVAP